MTVIVVSPFAANTPHYETSLEIAQKHLDQGDNVQFIVCNSSLPICQVNPNHHLGTCGRCIGKRGDGLQQLSSDPTLHSIIDLSPEDRETIRALPDSFTSREELRNFKVESFDAGMGVLSSVISRHREPKIDPQNEAILKEIRQRLRAAVAVYFSTLNHIDSIRPDRVYAYNGRFATQRAVLRASQRRNINCFIHERGGRLDLYQLHKNTLPHNIKHVVNEVRKYWNSDIQEREKKAVSKIFFENRAKGYAEGWFSYTKKQKENRLPSGFYPSQHNIAIFPSSEDELAAIGKEWDNSVYSEQIDGIKRVSKELKNDSTTHVYVRSHPNLEGLRNTQTVELSKIDVPGCTVIPPGSEISSYALLRAADTVLTFGSTMGIEATYWRKPSVLAGMSFYRDLGGTYNPESHEAVVDLLQDRTLEPKPLEPALMYGFYQRQRGRPFEYFEPDDIFEGEFKGKSLSEKPTLLHRIAIRLLESSKLRPFTKVLDYLSRAWSRRKLN